MNMMHSTYLWRSVYFYRSTEWPPLNNFKLHRSHTSIHSHLRNPKSPTI
jgi:hypothetical protein